jgi:hypothetical protein
MVQNQTFVVPSYALIAALASTVLWGSRAYTQPPRPRGCAHRSATVGLARA